MPQFKDAQEMLDNWMTDQVKLSLSDFGTRKLFDALKRCMWAKTRKSLSNLQFLKETGPQPPSNECLRCTKQHPGGPDTCRSKDRVSWGYLKNLLFQGEQRYLRVWFIFMQQHCRRLYLNLPFCRGAEDAEQLDTSILCIQSWILTTEKELLNTLAWIFTNQV